MTLTRRDLSLFLLCRMGSAGRVQQALAALGASAADAKAASSRVEAYGLMDLVRTLDRFERDIGPADYTEPLAEFESLWGRQLPKTTTQFVFVRESQISVGFKVRRGLRLRLKVGSEPTNMNTCTA